MQIPRRMLIIIPLLAGCVSAPPIDYAARPIIAFGDSYTEGNGARTDEAYPARLGAALGRPVLNKGVTGETAAEGARRLDRDVIRNNPELVIVEFGVNEAYRGRPVAESLAAIEAIVERIENETDAKVILVGVHFWTFQEDFDDGLRDIAKRHDAGLVLDVLEGIVSSQRDADDGDPSLRADAFHPNAKGYEIMARRIQPEVAAKLAIPAANRATDIDVTS